LFEGRPALRWRGVLHPARRRIEVMTLRKGALITLFYLGVATLVSAKASLAQEKATGGAEEKQERKLTFLDLRDRRTTLEFVELPKVREELQSLRVRQREIRAGEFELDRAKRTLESAKQERPPEPRKVAFFEERVNRAEGELKNLRAEFPDGVEAEIKKKDDELRGKERERADVERRLNDVLSVELVQQDFKQLMSGIFAGLVGMVILGFFSIAFWDQRVREKMFTGQSGIQFVTLFSLVIAIILFGITGILEGKELAALLGGLSGYILGRVSP
jgi:uncharacterized membrane protein